MLLCKNRTHNNGELTIANVGEVVELKGWCAKKRNLGSLVFIDIRDKYGITQLRCDETVAEVSSQIKTEYVIYAKGVVVERESKNKNIPTGEIEITILPSRETDVIITVDGQKPYDLKQGYKIKIKQIEKKVKLVGCTTEKFYDALCSKLNWSGGPHA